MSENNEGSVAKVEDKQEAKNENENENENGHDQQESDPHYEPIISLPEIEVPTLEEEETVMVNLRAKVYRYDSNENPPEWKERGTGNIKMLHHKANETVRVVMRRDKTLKLCANHFITSNMELKPSSSCDRAWVYPVEADYIDEKAKTHLLALKFSDLNNAQKWKDAFEEAKKIVANNKCPNYQTLENEKKDISHDELKLNDSFDEEKKNIVSSEENNAVISDFDKKSSIEMAEKLTTLTIAEKEKGDCVS